jgi:RNA polymerase sigma-70 factor (ECF subfamily)
MVEKGYTGQNQPAECPDDNRHDGNGNGFRSAVFVSDSKEECVALSSFELEPIPIVTTNQIAPPAAIPQPIFATTHWSVVLAAGQSDSAKGLASLEQLCQSYWRPLYIYIRRRGYNEADAKDLTQAFFAWVIERNWLARADQQRGRFRSFLLTSASAFLANEWDKSQTQKRGGGQVFTVPFSAAENENTWEPADRTTPEQSFEWRWALTLLDKVMNRLAADYEAQGKGEMFNILKPCLLGERDAQPYKTLAAKLSMTEGSVKVAVYRLRQNYRTLLRAEIAGTVGDPADVDEELRHLFAVLAR